MPNNKAPAYQWFPKDYETDEAVKLMTYEQEGIYRRLLDHQALHGSIPSEPQAIAKLLPKIASTEFLALWPAIAAKFPTVDNRRVNHKLERVKAHFAEFLARQSHAGKQSAQLRLRLYGTAQPPKQTASISTTAGPDHESEPAHPDQPRVSSSNTPEPTPEQRFESLFRTAVEGTSTSFANTLEPAPEPAVRTAVEVASASASAFAFKDPEQTGTGTSGEGSVIDQLLPKLRKTYGRRKSHGRFR
jgi:hypothetical protein